MPDYLDLKDPTTAKRLWMLLEATDWKWPPDVLLKQDEAVMDDLMAISYIARKIERQVRDWSEIDE